MQQGPLIGVKACVFDAYGTLFDFASAAARCADIPADRRAALTTLWRDKQLQYTWLRTLENRYVDFWQVTGEALDFALESLGLADPTVRDRLMELYLGLEPFPEVPAVLGALRKAGYKTAILSNGSPSMLEALVSRSGLEPCSTPFCRSTPFARSRPIRASTNTHSTGLRCRLAQLRSSRRTPGMRTQPRTSACASYGAIVMANAASGFPAGLTSRSRRWPNCRRSSARTDPASSADQRAGLAATPDSAPAVRQ